jgi:hypothetical protein
LGHSYQRIEQLSVHAPVNISALAEAVENRK